LRAEKTSQITMQPHSIIEIATDFQFQVISNASTGVSWSAGPAVSQVVNLSSSLKMGHPNVPFDMAGGIYILWVAAGIVQVVSPVAGSIQYGYKNSRV